VIKGCIFSSSTQRHFLSLLQPPLDKIETLNQLPMMDLPFVFSKEQTFISDPPALSLDCVISLNQVLSLLFLFPISYFNTKERECLSRFIILIEIINSIQITKAGVDERVHHFQVGLINRKLIYILLEGREDSVFTVRRFFFFNYLLN
jgi:hypothetical protein